MANPNTDIERLEAILRELKEAVIVCDAGARILLYNKAASRLFHDYDALGLGKSLYRICAQAPLEHNLRMLKNRTVDKGLSDLAEHDTQFICGTVDDMMLLNCRISMIAIETDPGEVFVFTFADITSKVTEMGQQGNLVEKMIQELRSPITNLNTAIDNLQQYPDMPPEVRRDFEQIVFRESGELTRRFENIVEASQEVSSGRWPMFDVYSADLVGWVANRLAEEDDFPVNMIGVPLWLYADSYLLMLVLERVVRFVRDTCKLTEVDIEVLLGDRRVCIDIVWPGEPISQSAINSILTEGLQGAVESMTVGEALFMHDSEIWSQKHRRPGYSLLRIPVADSSRQWEVPREPLPERREFYDFTLADNSGELGAMAERPLSSLDYVVFDIETTGFRPAEGDEILAIAAVRIVNGRLLSGERFERLIKPERPIPESSLPFLEIQEDMLVDEPPAGIVLPQFRSFVCDAVMVGHNPAIDIQFLEGSGVRFENPVLDTLLMALIMDRDRTNYTLKDISYWIGVEVMRSGSLMDDCFLTAQIFLKLLDLLAEKGIKTLGELTEASRSLAEEKRKQSL